MITGGGTGGHVFPGIAIAKALSDRGLDVAYVGSASGMEAKLVPPTGIPFFTVKTGAVKNQSIFTIAKTLVRLVLATLWSFRFLSKEKPSAVIGVGGYVSVPLSFAAFLKHTPLYLQEQNTSVGIANRFLGKLCRRVFVGFEEAKKYFPARKCVVTGNPIRLEFFSVPEYQPDANCLLVFGGSQGARAINDALVELYPRIKARAPHFRIIHQTGEKEFERVRPLYEKMGADVELLPFLKDMPAFYAKASLVLSRSGALTISELIQVGRPAILVPFPRRGQNDQLTNAYYLQENGAAQVVEQGTAFLERLWISLELCLDSQKLAEMSQGYSKLRRTNPLVTIADLVQQDLAD